LKEVIKIITLRDKNGNWLATFHIDMGEVEFSVNENLIEIEE